MKTRDKILEKSRELFNQKGIGKVSARDICEALSISPGNFTYYFPSKPQIEIELYHMMMVELEGVDTEITFEKDQISYFLEYHRLVFYIQDKYRFYYLNTFELLKQQPEIWEGYLRHIEEEKARMKRLLLGYLRSRVFRKDVDEQTIDRLIKVGHMVYSFWIIDAEVHQKEQPSAKVVHYLELCCSLIEPFLTPSALLEFKGYFRSLGDC